MLIVSGRSCFLPHKQKTKRLILIVAHRGLAVVLLFAMVFSCMYFEILSLFYHVYTMISMPLEMILRSVRDSSCDQNF